MSGRAVAWAFALLASAGGLRAAEPFIRYSNELLGVYVGDRQESGKTRIFIHRQDKGGSPEAHVVNGELLDRVDSYPFYGLVFGEVALEDGKPLEVYSGCVSIEASRGGDGAALVAGFRAVGAKPFRLTPQEVGEQPKKLLAALAVFYEKRLTPQDSAEGPKRTHFCINLLRLIGRRAHADIVAAYLAGNGYAGAALDVAASPYVASVWARLSEADRWKLVALEKCVEAKAAMALALASLDSDSQEHQRKAITWLGKHKAAEGRAPLLKRLNTAALQLRWDIVEALTQIGGEDVVAALIALLAPDSWAAKGLGLVPPPGFPGYYWPDGRVIIVRALGELGDARAAPALFKVLEEKGPGRGYLAEFIVPVLAQLGYKEAIPTLRTILAAETLAGVPADKPWINPAAVRATVRRLTAAALYRLGDSSGRDLLLQELKSGDWMTRRFAAEALARYGVKRDVSALAACLNDRDWEVNLWACRGVARLTGALGQKKDWMTVDGQDGGMLLLWWDKHKAEFAEPPK